MKLLLVCPYFPPENTIAAVRLGKFAQHWAERGHTVTVLSRNPITDGLRALDNQGVKIMMVPDPLGGVAKRTASAPLQKTTSRFQVLDRVRAFGRLLLWPDFYGPWAARAASRLRRISPLDVDVVIASVSPYSALLLGYLASKRLKRPLVIDYRDMLAFGPYYDHGRLRTWFDQRIERSIIRRAALLAAVSEPMSEELARFGRPTLTVTNGFDPDDFAQSEYRPRDERLRIVYCGQIYKGRRDPSPLFEALKIVNIERPDLDIGVDFYGRGLSEVLSMAETIGVGDAVAYHGEVTHDQSLQLQSNADLLLLLLWNNPGERGVLSGKLFEYMGARRPIIMLGLEEGAAGELIRTNELGVVSNSPVSLSRHLIKWAEMKQRNQTIPAPPDGALMRFTRRAQSDKLIDSIEAELGLSD